MSLAENRNGCEYDDARARAALRKAIAAHQAKAAELADMRAAIASAEGKLSRMKEEIDKVPMPRMPRQLQKPCGAAPRFPSAPRPGGRRKNATS
jgi:hypothetical protein